MATKNQNPYKSGNYLAMFAFFMSFKGKPEITRTNVIDFCMKELGMFMHTSFISATVVLSPRDLEFDGRGDCRGNRSSAGHAYFMHLPARKFFDADGNLAKYKTVDGKEIAMHKVDGKWIECEGKIALEEQRYQLKFRKIALPVLNGQTCHMTMEEAENYWNEKAEAKAEKQAEKAEADKVKAEAKVEADKVKAKKVADKAEADKVKAEAQAKKVADRETARTKRLADAEAAKALKAAEKAKKQAEKLATATAKVDEIAKIAEEAKANAEAHAAKMAKVIPSETEDVETEDVETEEDDTEELAEA